MAAMHNVMVRATPLSNVGGRIDYISNPERQEHLQAVHSTTVDPTFWKALAGHCQEQAKHSKTKRACEGREFMIPLANDLAAMNQDELAGLISARIKKLTGTENVTAIHWNKARTNYHAHVVFAENEEVNEVSHGAVLTRNTYYDAAGKRSTKKECLDGEGNLKHGCRFYAKGEQIETITRFGAKKEWLSGKGFLQTVKADIVDFQNELLQDERFKVFDRKDVYLAEQHIGKNLTDDQETAVRLKNALVRDFNATVEELVETAGKTNETAFQAAIRYIAACREKIKEHRLTEKWILAIEFYVTQIRKYTKSLQAQLGKITGRQKETPAEQPKPGIDALIKGADHRRGETSRQNSDRARRRDDGPVIR